MLYSGGKSQNKFNYIRNSMKRIIIGTISIFINLLISQNLFSGMPGDKVLKVFVDEYGNPWFGTDNGLIRKCSDVWKAYPVQPDSPGTVNDISSMPASSGKMIWIATGNGILKITYNENDLTSAKRYFSKKNKFLSDVINSVTVDKYSTVFFATTAGVGLLSGTVWSFLDNVQDILGNHYLSAESENDTIYLGTLGEGVGRLVREADAYSGATSLMAPWSAIPGNDISVIFTDSRGNQWFGSETGLSHHTKLDAKEGWDVSFTKYLPDPHVNAIGEDSKGNIWVGTHGGLARFEGGKPGNPEVFKLSNGLPSDIINDFHINPDDTFWIGTDSGASFFDGKSFKNYTTSSYISNLPSFKKILKIKVK